MEGEATTHDAVQRRQRDRLGIHLRVCTQKGYNNCIPVRDTNVSFPFPYTFPSVPSSRLSLPDAAILPVSRQSLESHTNLISDTTASVCFTFSAPSWSPSPERCGLRGCVCVYDDDVCGSERSHYGGMPLVRRRAEGRSMPNV